jgi:hypothetical protein
VNDDHTPRLGVKLRADWGTGPLWVSKGDGFSDPYDADDITEVIALSDELRAAIAAWDARFQATYNDEYPPDSAFSTPADETTFIADGRALAGWIKGEVPADVTVGYVPLDTGVYEPVEPVCGDERD